MKSFNEWMKEKLNESVLWEKNGWSIHQTKDAMGKFNIQIETPRGRIINTVYYDFKDNKEFTGDISGGPVGFDFDVPAHIKNMVIEFYRNERFQGSPAGGIEP